ncbi:MAG: ribosomal RNA small subunit methyltransferase I [Candidatus Tyloplasma litorale]|nr:MAG: ribosomal RNA small subunit methyltransferase I [Mycoplasmatales bacterium]
MHKIYVIPTPIGNLNDFTLRSIEILKSVKYLFCEDTKVTGKLKKYLNLDLQLISLHKFNEVSRISEIEKILIKDDIAIVSDAGTPTISDPGQKIIHYFKKMQVKIIPLPGANAITTALSGSGLEFSSFTFIGFLEKEESKINHEILKHLNSDVIICYESPNRINKTLFILNNRFGNIKVVIARELTKIYEEILYDNISNLIDKTFKGEIVLLIPTIEIKNESNNNLKEHIDKLKKLKIDNKSIINYLSTMKMFKKNDVYNYLKNSKY